MNRVLGCRDRPYRRLSAVRATTSHTATSRIHKLQLPYLDSNALEHAKSATAFRVKRLSERRRPVLFLPTLQANDTEVPEFRGKKCCHRYRSRFRSRFSPPCCRVYAGSCRLTNEFAHTPALPVLLRWYTRLRSKFSGGIRTTQSIKSSRLCEHPLVLFLRGFTRDWSILKTPLAGFQCAIPSNYFTGSYTYSHLKMENI